MTGQTSAKRILVIHNPAAGRRRKELLRLMVERLDSLGCEVTVRDTLGPGHARDLAAEGAEKGFSVLVAAGGDGTVNEAIQDLNKDAPPLAVAPLGTANVIAKEIGMSHDPVKIAETIADGQTDMMYVGRANGRRFALAAGVGLDAHAVANVNQGVKRVLGKGAYVIKALETILRFPYPAYDVSIDGQLVQARSVVVANGYYYGGDFTCAPEASIWTPNLQVCLLLKAGAFNGLRYASALACGRLSSLPDVKTLKASTITVTGPEGDPVQGDGDVITRLPLKITVDEQPIQVIRPT